MFMLDEILSRLPIKGALKTGGTSAAADHLVIIGNSGLIDGSLIPDIGDIVLSAELTSFDPTYPDWDSITTNHLLALNPTNVQDAIEDLDKVKLSKSDLFNDIANGNKAQAFTNLSVNSGASTSYRGVAYLATSGEVETGTDAVKIVTPATATSSYLKKSGGSITGSVLTINPTVATQVANKQYVDSAITAAALSATTTTKLVWVSTTGSDSTGASGVVNRPFLTLAAAKTAAVSGDTVMVLPGSYNVSSNLFKAGVNWYFFPSTTITFNGSGILFDDTGLSASTVKITGHAAFASSGASRQLLKLNNTGTTLFEAYSMTTNGSNTISVSGATDFRLKLHQLTVAEGAALTLSAGTNNISIDNLSHSYTSSGSTVAIVISNGTNIINVTTGVTNRAYVSISGGTTVLYGDSATSVNQNVNSSAGTCVIYIKKLITSGAGTFVINGSATASITIDACDVISTDASSSFSTAIFITSTVTLTLKNCTITSGTLATISIDTDTTVNVNGRGYVSANRATSSDVTVLGGLFEII